MRQFNDFVLAGEGAGDLELATCAASEFASLLLFRLFESTTITYAGVYSASVFVLLDFVK